MIREGSGRPAAGDLPVRGARTISPLLDSDSAAFRAALAALERAARHDGETVLITGESGTGKTLLAHHLHRCSPRRGKVFHRVSLASIADGLASSDLFGHLQGAFTDARSRRLGHFVEATGGTLFLDEIGKASEVVQHRLLDAIERQEVAPVGADRTVRVDVRLVAASNVCLRLLAEQGRFLPDLHARLEAFTIRIPSLAERRVDIPDLARHFVAQHAPAMGYTKTPGIAPELIDALAVAPWPRNVRQLDGTVRRILVEAEGAAELAPRHWEGFADATSPGIGRQGMHERVIRETVARERSKSAAARKLGISRATLYRYMDDIDSRGAAG